MCTHCDVLIFPFSVNCHKLSTVHVLCVNTLLEHLSALHGDSNTCGNGILFILSHKSLHITYVHYFKSVLPFSATKRPNLACSSSMDVMYAFYSHLPSLPCCSMTMWRVLVASTVTYCPTYIFSIINLRLAEKTDEYLPS